MDKNADQPLPPASMSKLMTINMLFEALRDGRVHDGHRPSPSRPGRKAMRRLDHVPAANSDRPTVEELIHGIIVQLGQRRLRRGGRGAGRHRRGLCRADDRTRRRRLGMTASTFANASGWPDPQPPHVDA
ncbi:MAG: hypothetical protein V9E89_19215 [Ilumatobacteraceae bacterium]